MIEKEKIGKALATAGFITMLVGLDDAQAVWRQQVTELNQRDFKDAELTNQRANHRREWSFRIAIAGAQLFLIGVGISNLKDED